MPLGTAFAWLMRLSAKHRVGLPGEKRVQYSRFTFSGVHVGQPASRPAQLRSSGCGGPTTAGCGWS
jgi:hypothetical protein